MKHQTILPEDFAVNGQDKKKNERRLEVAAYQVEGENHMADVIFPKRTPTPRELDTRPIPGDYRPRRMRLLDGGGAESESCYGDDLRDHDHDHDVSEVTIDFSGQLRLPRPEDELSRNRLNEIAALMRALTYGEMIE